MRRTVLLLLLAMSVASCGGGAAGRGLIGDAGMESGGDTGDLFGTQPVPEDGAVPVADDPVVEQKEPVAPEEKAADIDPVEFSKKPGSLGSCVIGEQCEMTITARGGSKEYIWSHVGGKLPKGLEFADTTKKRIKIQKIAGKEIEEVGEFAFTLKVQDKADAARSAEGNFTLSINENIAMVLSAIAADEGATPVLTPLEVTGADGKALPITIPPKGRLLAEVIGHAESYRWSINGQEVVCNNDGCEGAKDGLRLYKDTALEPPNPPEHAEYVVLEATESRIGVESTGVVIAAADAFGDTASKTIQSITFAQDPCAVPMAINGYANAAVTLDKEVVYNKKWSAAVAVSGNSGPVAWTAGAAEIQTQYGLTFAAAPDGQSGTVSGVFHPAEGMALEEYKKGLDLTLSYTVKDTCPNRSPQSITINVTVGSDEDILKFDPSEMVQELVISANDTDEDTTIEASLPLGSDTIAEWVAALGLDPYGDEGPCSFYQDCTDGGMQNVADAPQMKFADRKDAKLENITSVLFATKDPNGGDKLDVNVFAYEIRVPCWVGIAEGTGSEYEDIGPGSFSYTISWTYNCAAGYEKGCEPVRTREIGLANAGGKNQLIRGVLYADPGSFFEKAGMSKTDSEALSIVLSMGGTEWKNTIKDVTGSDTAASVGTAVLSGGLSAVGEAFDLW